MDPLRILLTVSVGLGAVVAIGAALRKLWGLNRRAVQVIDVLLGDGNEQLGLPVQMRVLHETIATLNNQVSGLGRELAGIKHELHPNSSLSLRDSVDRTEATAAELQGHMEALQAQVARNAETSRKRRAADRAEARHERAKDRALMQEVVGRLDRITAPPRRKG